MKCHSLFSVEKIRKNTFTLSSAESAQRLVKVKLSTTVSEIRYNGTTTHLVEINSKQIIDLCT